MKKLLFAICATALLGLTAGCVDPVENNPNYDPNTNTVNTMFVLNIAAADKPATKQTSTIAQFEGNFRGIDNAHLFAFIQGNDGKKVLDPGQANAVFDLSAAIAATDIGGSSGNSSKRVMELSLPVGTNSLIFYGMSTKGSLSKDEAGSLEYIMNNNINEIGSFASPRLDTRNTVTMRDYGEIENAITAVLNHLLKVGINGQNAWDSYSVSSVTGGSSTISVSGALHWADYKNCAASVAGDKKSPITPANDAVALETILGNAYASLVSMANGELRAGSGEAVQQQIKDLYGVMNDVKNATPVNAEERLAQIIAERVMAYIKVFFTDAIEWNDTDNLRSNSYGVPITISQASVDPQTQDPIPANSHSAASFPTDFALPKGAAILSVASTNDGSQAATEAAVTLRNAETVYNRFSYSRSGLSLVGNGIDITNITYSPELCYYCNSPVRVSVADEITPSNYPDGSATWETYNETNWPSTKWESSAGHVKTSTRGVAMMYNVQYGMALLVTSVKYGTNTLSDNNNALHNDPDNTFNINNDCKLTLTGILVGGQPSIVNWQYLPWRNYTGGFNANKVVYDRTLEDGAGSIPLPADANGGDLSTPNYTILFDNYNSSAAQDVVYIALEFKNDLGKDFWGEKNLVRNGGTFYLCAELNPSEKSWTSWPTNNMMPPYDNDGNTVQTPRVFMADTKTIANIKLGPNALKHAYVTVPDLRSANISFGMSVDLNWQTGLQFTDIEIGPEQ